MNLILFAAEERIEPSHLRLTDARFAHIRDTLRAKKGDILRVGEINGLMGSGEITALSDNGVELALDLNQPPPPKRPLTLVLALPRPKMIRRIFRTIAELGVSELHVINSYRVEKSYWQSPALAPEAVTHYLLEGLQQARDTALPSVSLHRLFKPFVEDELADLAAESLRLVAHPGIGQPCPRDIDQPVTLAIGPEGGFTTYEVDKLLAANFEAVHLGERILRVETAVTALTSRLFSL